MLWLKDMGCVWYPRTIHAAAFGTIESHKMAERRRLRVVPRACSACSAAGKNGHLEALRYLRGSDCTWDEDTCNAEAGTRHIECFGGREPTAARGTRSRPATSP
ncbi:unnamed protein product [Phaeothamnion confervicola]